MKNEQLVLLGERAEAYIWEHLSEKLDRDTICRALSTNRTTLSRALILCTGMTPASYVKMIKESVDAVFQYRFDGETLPQLPCLHDCAISRIALEGEYLTLYFEEDLFQYESVSRLQPGMKRLVVRYHLIDPCMMVYRRFSRKTDNGQGYEIGYLEYEDQNEFLEAASDMELLYLYHRVGYNAISLKLWSYKEPHDVIMELSADYVEYKWNFGQEKNETIEAMKVHGIRFEDGMSDKQLSAAEKRFGFTFPKEIAAFLRQGVPVGEHFFDYRDLSDENMEKFRRFQKIVEEGFAFDVANVPHFLRDMEHRYGTRGADETLDAIMREYEKSPKLIPFYGHRCFFDGLDNMPILSYAQPCDTIIYGENFEVYLKKEFCGEKVVYPLRTSLFSNKLGIWHICIRMEPYIAAHSYCTRNRETLKRSKKCGCFYCLNIFSASEIDQWIDEDQTALCPHCHIDSVIGDASGYSVTKEFLKTMNEYWFSSVETKK